MPGAGKLDTDSFGGWRLRKQRNLGEVEIWTHIILSNGNVADLVVLETNNTREGVGKKKAKGRKKRKKKKNIQQKGFAGGHPPNY